MFSGHNEFFSCEKLSPYSVLQSIDRPGKRVVTRTVISQSINQSTNHRTKQVLRWSTAFSHMEVCFVSLLQQFKTFLVRLLSHHTKFREGISLILGKLNVHRYTTEIKATINQSINHWSNQWDNESINQSMHQSNEWWEDWNELDDSQHQVFGCNTSHFFFISHWQPSSKKHGIHFQPQNKQISRNQQQQTRKVLHPVHRQGKTNKKREATLPFQGRAEQRGQS